MKTLNHYEHLKTRMLQKIDDKQTLREFRLLENSQRRHAGDLVKFLPPQKKTALQNAVIDGCINPLFRPPDVPFTTISAGCVLPPYYFTDVPYNYPAYLINNGNLAAPEPTFYQQRSSSVSLHSGELSMACEAGQVSNLLYLPRQYIDSGNMDPLHPLTNHVGAVVVQIINVSLPDVQNALGTITVELELPANPQQVFQFFVNPPHDNSLINLNAYVEINLQARTHRSLVPFQGYGESSLFSATEINGAVFPSAYNSNPKVLGYVQLDSTIESIQVWINVGLDIEMPNGFPIDPNGNKLHCAMIDLRSPENISYTIPSLGGGSRGPGALKMKSICWQIDNLSPV
jgi:hypothetical protein